VEGNMAGKVVKKKSLRDRTIGLRLYLVIVHA